MDDFILSVDAAPNKVRRHVLPEIAAIGEMIGREEIGGPEAHQKEILDALRPFPRLPPTNAASPSATPSALSKALPLQPNFSQKNATAK